MRVVVSSSNAAIGCTQLGNSRRPLFDWWRDLRWIRYIASPVDCVVGGGESVIPNVEDGEGVDVGKDCNLLGEMGETDGKEERASK